MSNTEKRSRDMHLHTYYSDGTLTPVELVDRALSMGMKTIAITDHDGTNGLEEAVNYGKKVGLKVIPGIEFSTMMPFGQSGELMNAHILGYEIDYKNPELLKAIDGIRRQRAERNEKLLAALNAAGYKIEEKDLISRRGQDYIGKPNFALALVKKGYIKTTGEANTKGAYLKHPKARIIHREKISAKRAIELIKGAGGYSVLAHPMKLKYPAAVVGDKKARDDEDWPAKKFELLEEVLGILMSYGLDGLECMYSSHSKVEEKKLVEMAQRLSLRVSGGSDFHGPEFLPKVEIGGF